VSIVQVRLLLTLDLILLAVLIGFFIGCTVGVYLILRNATAEASCEHCS
jgi:ABC-type dipeptide/oligopeptide/nickel transport system permease component